MSEHIQHSGINIQPNTDRTVGVVQEVQSIFQIQLKLKKYTRY